MGGRIWTEAEDAIVRSRDPKAIAKLDRTHHALAVRRVRLGLRSGIFWREWEDDALRRGDLDALAHRTRGAIGSRRLKLGLQCRANAWTAAEDAVIVAAAEAAVWPAYGPDWRAVAGRIGRTHRAVRQRACILRRRWREAAD